MKNFQDAGFVKNDLLPVPITIRAANKISINILGDFRATVSGMSPKNEVVSCNSVIAADYLLGGYGFVVFNDARDADDAVYEMNNQPLYDGRITVEHAKGTPRLRNSNNER